MTRDRGPGAMRALREGFVSRAVARGVPRATAREVFSWTEGFAAYGFSAAHAASFAELAYASAHMRAHFPAEYLVAVLNSQPMGFYSPRAILNEARRIGLCVLPADVHLSGEGFTVEDDGAALRVGLKYAKGLSKKGLSSILQERSKASFDSTLDLYRRTAVERDVLENLVKGGFLDALSPTGDAGGRAALLAEVSVLPKKPRLPSRRGQDELPLPHPARRGRREGGEELRGPGFLRLSVERRETMEWEALSLNVFRHPLSPYRAALRELGVTPSSEILELAHGTRARAAGLLEVLQRPPTKSGRPVYFLLIEDEAGLFQATIFEGVYNRDGHVLHQRGAFLLDGRVEQDERRGFSFLVERVRDLSGALEGTERVPEPRAASSSGAFIRARRRGRRAG
jgi:error-prone DNA polymerase